MDSSGEMDSLYRFYMDLAKDGPNAVEPRLFPNFLPNAAASRAAIAFGLKALNLSLAGSFPGGESALALAYSEIKRDPDRIILAGGVDQGAAFMAVESLAAARKRKARIYAEVFSSREGFDAEKPGKSSDCFCLVKAFKRLASGEVSRLTYRSSGLWGGWAVFELRKV